MYGICNLSIVPVRKESSDKSELVTQLLFGDAYIIQESNDKWCKIKLMFDEYEGWIDKIQHNQVPETTFEHYLMTSHPTNYDDVALVEHKNGTQLISIGSTLPFLSGRNFKIGEINYTFQGDLYQLPVVIEPDLIKFFALRYNHTPYLWGGKTNFGIDCSGFVQQIYKLLGYKIMRDAYQQANHGVQVKDLQNIKTGDLAFFSNDAGKIIHVGLILEDHKIIHAHGQVRIDFLDEKGIYNLTTKKYSHTLTQINRIMN